MQANGISYMETILKEENKDAVVAVIRETTDYKQFRGIIGNRGISDRHVMQLIKSINKRDMLKYNPGIVTKNKEIIDGQHRQKAAEALSKPYYYIEISDLEAAGLEEVQQLNTYNKTWTVQDYLDSYIIKGKKPYEMFKEFIEQYELSVEGGFILIFGDNGGKFYQVFRNGEMQFSEEQLQKAKEIADILTDARKYMSGGNYRRVYLLKAIRLIYEKGLGKRFTTKLELSQTKLQLQFNLRDYLRMFEDVLNWSQKTDIVRLF